MAVGATPRDVLDWEGRRALLLTGAGLGFGALLAVIATRALRQALLEVSALDPATYIWSALGLGLVALVAAWQPARRATRVDPVRVLREE